MDNPVIDSIDSIAARREQYGMYLGIKVSATAIMDLAIAGFCEGDPHSEILREASEQLSRKADGVLAEWRKTKDASAWRKIENFIKEVSYEQ